MKAARNKLKIREGFQSSWQSCPPTLCNGCICYRYLLADSFLGWEDTARLVESYMMENIEPLFQQNREQLLQINEHQVNRDQLLQINEHQVNRDQLLPPNE